MKDDKYMLILSIYVDSVLQDFENFLRTEIVLVEDDIRLVLDEYISGFICYELEPGIYAFKDISKALFNILHPEYRVYNNPVDIKYEDKTMKTKLVVRPGILARTFDEKSFLNTILGFTTGWDYKHYNKYNSQEVVNLSSTNKILLKANLIDDSVVNGIRESIFSVLYYINQVGIKCFANLKQFIIKK